jgi:ABC-type Fe3+/spermidine/putrescine transport system ATPase subunit
MLELKNISFAYDENNAIENLSFTVAKGQNITIIGESGCGKSTLLKLIYGFYDLNQGEISYDKKPILGPKFNLITGEDYIKYMAQDFDLMPYITVSENVGKYLSNVDLEKKKERILELLEMVEVTEFANVKAQFLSGGQQQRVALAKVLAHEPEILLLDEPFSQIDTFRKNSLRRNLFHYLKSKQITCLIATHDGTDALSFSDETIVLQNGNIIAKENPQILFENPKSKYVASLFSEVNEIPTYLLYQENLSNDLKLVYPFQLKIADSSALKVTVKQNYFRGNCYLIKSKYEFGILFFESKNFIKTNTEIYLTL